MLLDDIKPYAKNARHNKRAIPAVAQSIKDFGFKGAIVLRSHKDPTIVNGHTRVAALKYLGWKEIPDENIVWADDLTDDEVKALRLADNKTAELATWNKTLLQHEIRSLKGFDMSKFNFDFKSKTRPFAAERLRTDRAYNLAIANRTNTNDKGYPALEQCFCIPDGMVGFNYAKSMTEAEKKNKACHFFIDDYQFERIWAAPDKYIEHLKGFKCVLTPDFSMYLDMPAPMQAWNHYRCQVIGKFLQDHDIKVIATLSWATPDTHEFCFEGIPTRSVVAVSTVGVKQSDTSLAIWQHGMTQAIKTLKPRCILLYGGRVDFDFKRIKVIEFDNQTTERLKHGR